ncbi:MAG: hypothetical protein MUP45_00280 [Candidatus Marinimicrobia bacterium]|nr:hypothetical protein [Candidatus Neomarinimicrobiota bacterium]
MSGLERILYFSFNLVGIDVLNKRKVERMEGGEHLVATDEVMFLARKTWKPHRRVTVVRPKGEPRSFQEITKTHAGEEVVVYLKK